MSEYANSGKSSQRGKDKLRRKKRSLWEFVSGVLERLDKGGFVGGLEIGAARDEDVGSGGSADLCGLLVDAAIYLQLAGGILPVDIRRMAATFGIMSSMKDCPPKPGSTVMTRIRLQSGR